MEATLSDLREQVDDLGSRFPKLTDDNLFVTWYLTAMLVEDEKIAAESVMGGSSDKSVDALLIDDDALCVFIVQAKYRTKIRAASEHRSDVIAFANLVSIRTTRRPTLW